ARDLHGDGNGRSGRDACGEQCDEPVGHGGDRRQLTALGDREGRERESRDRGGGDVRGGGGARDEHRWGPAHERERRGDGGELDVECHGGQQYADRDVGVALREPGDVHSDGDGGHGRDDCREQCDEPVGHGGHGGRLAAVGDPEGCERESGGASGGRVGGGPGGRDDQGRQSADQRERGGDGGELDVESHGGLAYSDGDGGFDLRKSGHVYGDGDGGHGGDDCGEQCDEPVGHGGYGGQYAAVGDREGCERESGGGSGG